MASGTVHPRSLRCEQRDRPQGVGSLRPRFSWRLRSEERGQEQRAYRIVVATASAVTGDDRSGGDWDSGWVTDSEHVCVRYDGTPLRSSTRYRWTVRVRDTHGRESDTVSSWFDTGILHADEWEASWIGRDPYALAGVDVPSDRDRSLRCEHLSPPLQLRRTLHIDRPASTARIHVSARGLYRLHVNGTRVGADELTPGWTDYTHRIPYQTYDVTNLLLPGENVLAATVADGWWCGFVGMDARHQAQHYGTEPQLLAQLVIDREDGSREIIGTDAAWRERVGEIVYADLLMGQQTDARCATPGWTHPGYDDHDWQAARIVDTDIAALVATGDEPVRATEELAARSVTRRGDVQLVDVGQNMVGRVRLTVRGAERGRRIRLRHGEALDEDGGLYTENLRSAEATDVYYAAGHDIEVFEPFFTTHGFRWVEVGGYPGDLDAADVTGVVLHSDTEFVGEFDCDDPLVTQLHRNIVWGQRGNFVSVPTDCPQRDERLGWLADAHIFAPTACFNADTAAFYARWLTDVVSGQDTDGAFPDVAPRVCLYREGAPAWGDAGVLLPWLLYRNYGDEDVLSRCFEPMRAWVDHVQRHNPDLIWRHRRGNDYGDWLQVDATTPREVVATAYFARSAHTVALAAAALGRTAAEEHYRALAEGIGTAFRAAFVGDDSTVTGETQTGYLLALAFGLLPDERVPAAVDHLVELLAKRGNRLTTGFLGVALLCPTLAEHGRTELAHALLTTTDYPSWGYSIVNGATTIWERWDGWTAERGFQSPAMNSFNHYSLGSVGEWLYSGVAGIDQQPDSVAWNRIRIRPSPGGSMTRAEASYDSVRGRVSSRWRRGDGTFVLDVEVPPGAVAEVHLPTDDPESVTETGRPVHDREGIARVEASERGVVCAVTSGRYEFMARDCSRATERREP